jgi:RNA polymerase sigma-70 factor (ECF subfamily)
VSAPGPQISLAAVRGPSEPAPPVEPAPPSPTRPSLDAVYRAHAKTVSRWASRLLGPGVDYEDVVQEVFMVVRRKLPHWGGPAAITTWLHEITVRVVQDWRRRHRWWSWVTGRGPSPSRGRARLPPSTDEGGHDPVARLEGRERLLLFYRILDGLGEAHRTTFILFELEGLPGERIAELTGTRPGTVWVRLTRARRAFIQEMRRLDAQGEQAQRGEARRDRDRDRDRNKERP